MRQQNEYNEQNIDDILQLLKDSVSGESTESFAEQERSAPVEEDVLSAEELQRRLLRQFASEDTPAAEGIERAYALDHDLLKDFEAGETEPASAVATAVAESSTDVEELEESDEENEERDATVLRETAEESLSLPDETAEPNPSAPVEIEELLSMINADAKTEDSVEESAEEAVEDDHVVEEEEILDYQEFPEIEQIALTDLLKDYASAEEPVGEDAVLMAEQVAASAESAVNDSVFDLMLQLCCEEELTRLSEEDLDEEFSDELTEEEAAELAELQSPERIEERRVEHLRLRRNLILQTVGVGILALILLFYETLPLTGVEFSGIADYHSYPGAYILIGMQWMLLAAACLWKPLLGGVKRFFTLCPDIYSVMDLLLVSVIAYDMTMVFIASHTLPPVFHFLMTLMLFVLSLSELLLLRRREKLFALAISEKSKFAPAQDRGKYSVSDSLYRGGLSPEATVYEPREADVPSGFCRLLKHEGYTENRLFSLLMIPAFLLAVGAAVVCMVMEESLQTAFVAALTVLFASLPLSAALVAWVIPCLSGAWLYRRGIALVGKETVTSCASCDVLIFKDWHLFRKCDPKQTGIVFYDSSRAPTILGSLQLLYARIGGPLSSVFEQVPEAYRFEDLRVRRITQKGIEALIDRRHVLLVGDRSFMKRYGLTFPEEAVREGRGSLCVSLDGRLSARINAGYTVEPLFDMLAERLEQEGISCVIETYDPLISAEFVAAARKGSRAPISIVHKNAAHLFMSDRPRRREQIQPGLLALSSRLKLAEGVIWCRRLAKIRKRCAYLSGAFCCLGLALSALLIGLRSISLVDQYWLLLFIVLSCLSVSVIALLGFPKKNYFTVEALEAERLVRAQREEAARQKKLEKQQRKQNK